MDLIDLMRASLYAHGSDLPPHELVCAYTMEYAYHESVDAFVCTVLDRGCIWLEPMPLVTHSEAVYFRRPGVRRWLTLLAEKNVLSGGAMDDPFRDMCLWHCIHGRRAIPVEVPYVNNGWGSVAYRCVRRHD